MQDSAAGRAGKTGKTGGVDEDAAHALMDRYLEMGGNHIDTADRCETNASRAL